MGMQNTGDPGCSSRARVPGLKALESMSKAKLAQLRQRIKQILKEKYISSVVPIELQNENVKYQKMHGPNRTV